MERRLLAVEHMDPAESATILALPGTGVGDKTGDDAGEITEDELTGAA